MYSISGTSFIDDDQDGIRDADKPGLPNWVIILNKSDGTQLMTTKTNVNGS